MKYSKNIKYWHNNKAILQVFRTNNRSTAIYKKKSVDKNKKVRYLMKCGCFHSMHDK